MSFYSIESLKQYLYNAIAASTGFIRPLISPHKSRTPSFIFTEKCCLYPPFAENVGIQTVYAWYTAFASLSSVIVKDLHYNSPANACFAKASAACSAPCHDASCRIRRVHCVQPFVSAFAPCSRLCVVYRDVRAFLLPIHVLLRQLYRTSSFSICYVRVCRDDHVVFIHLTYTCASIRSRVVKTLSLPIHSFITHSWTCHISKHSTERHLCVCDF